MMQSTNQIKHSRIRDVLGKTAVVLLGVSLAVVLLELAASQVLEPPYQTAKGRFGVECDRLVGWRGIPHMAKTMDTEGHTHQVVLNSRGMHDEEHAFEKEAGVIRILVIGDSFIEAEQVDEQETSHQVLEDILNSRMPPGRRVEVISAGVGGWGPAQELMYYRSEGRRYQPDVVIVAWFPGNDLLDNLPDSLRTGREGINCYAPYFVICDGRFDPRPWYSVPGLQPTWNECPAGKRWFTHILSWLYAHSRIYQNVEPVFVEGRERLQYQPMAAPWLKTKTGDEVLNYAYALNVHIYARLAQEVGDTGAETVFVLVPPREAVSQEANPDLADLSVVDEADLGDADPTLPHRTMAGMMQAHQLAVLDLQPYFVDYVKAGNEVPYGTVRDFHWNVGGNRLAGQVIAEWLIDQGIGPAE